MRQGWDKESKVVREIENWIELNAGINYIGQAIFTLLPSHKLKTELFFTGPYLLILKQIG